MPRHALIYIWAVLAAGATAIAAAALQWESADPKACLACLALAVLASTFKVALPGLTGTISPGFVFVLIGAGRLSWSETVVIGAAAGLIQSIWRSRTPPNPVQGCFNAATLGISGALAHGVCHGLTPKALPLDPVPLLVAALVLFVTNTLLVSLVICLLRNDALQSVWRSLRGWSYPYYLGGGLLASVWVRTSLTEGAWVIVFAALSVYFLDQCFRQFLERSQGKA